jgi:aryl-alcohol dehydrogenase-like predicted oxidoreductase
MFDAVTCAIPGAKRAKQVEENVAAADAPALSSGAMAVIDEIYDRLLWDSVHQRW